MVMKEMKEPKTHIRTPRTVRAYAAVSRSKPGILVRDIFRDRDFNLHPSERACLVEIRFLKWVR